MWEGLTPEVVIANEPAAYQALYADPVNQRPLGAEPLADFTERVYKPLITYVSDMKTNIF